MQIDMSLDVYLIEKEKFQCPNCKASHETGKTIDVFRANITHNLGKMADAAGIYYHLWNPEEINLSIAKELIEPLEDGLKKLKSNPDYFEDFNAPNGWGTYNQFVPFVEKYLEACKNNPDAEIYTDR